MDGFTDFALRSRVAGILTIFLTVLTGWLCVALPNPAPWVLGVELIVVALAAGTAFVVLNVRAERAADRVPLARVLDRVNPNIITAGLVGGAVGAWLIPRARGRGGGCISVVPPGGRQSGRRDGSSARTMRRRAGPIRLCG